ncbi:hypothetical protein [Methylosinus sp. Ce-a6]|uniref:hypothetical protein n=1 Tax=Methylosinus sp. Ce-a6 TaxID=2172005 RepID=UPI00135CE3D5|nr:hypothetical protein [Methylosinus sp. Ce-a6]
MAQARTGSRETALAFGVPPLLIGLAGDNTFRNCEEQPPTNKLVDASRSRPDLLAVSRPALR